MASIGNTPVYDYGNEVGSSTGNSLLRAWVGIKITDISSTAYRLSYGHAVYVSKGDFKSSTCHYNYTKDGSYYDSGSTTIGVEGNWYADNSWIDAGWYSQGETLSLTATVDYPRSDGTVTSYISGSYTVPTLSWVVSYNDNGGTGAPDDQTKYHDGDLTLSSTKPTRTGYTFSGWNTKSDGTGASYSAGEKYTTNEKVTLYAQWTPNTLLVQYNANGGSLNSDTYYLSDDLVYTKSDSSIYQRSWTYNIPHENGLNNASTFGLSRKGYTFLGWKVGSDGTTVFDQDDSSIVPTDLSDSIKTNSSSTVTVYAVWQANTYTIKFDANRGSGTTSQQTHIYDVSKNLTSNAFVRAGYTFVNWNTKQDGSGTSYNDEASVKNLSSTSGATVTLYAQWREHVLTVRYNSNYATYAYVDGAENTQVSADKKNVVVRTSKYKYSTPISDGLNNYSDVNDDTYMKRTRYDATGYWGTGSDPETEDIITVHEDMIFESGAELAKTLGILDSLEGGDVEIDLYAQWILLCSKITVYNEDGEAQRGMVHFYVDNNVNFITSNGDMFKDSNDDYFMTNDGAVLHYGIITIFGADGKAYMAI